MTTEAPQKPVTEREIEYVPFGENDPIKLTVKMVINLIAIKTKSGKLPTEDDATKFIMMCKSRKLNPWAGDCWLQGYDSKDGATFNIITAHQAFLKRAEVHPEFDGMESGVIVAQGDGSTDREGDFTYSADKLLGAWAVIYFKSRAHPMKKRLKLTTFRKPYGRWNDDPEGMIVKCAEADALRTAFPTMLGGMYLREETEMVQTKEDARFTPVRPMAQGTAPSAAVPTAAAQVAAPSAPTKPVAAEAPKAEPEPEPPLAEAPPVVAEPKPATPPEGLALENEQSPFEKLTALVAKEKLDEAKLCAWTCGKFKLSPCETLADLADIAPRRISHLVEKWDELLPQWKTLGLINA